MGNSPESYMNMAQRRKQCEMGVLPSSHPPPNKSCKLGEKAWLVDLGILDILLSRCLLIQKHFFFSFSFILPFALTKALQFSVSLSLWKEWSLALSSFYYSHVVSDLWLSLQSHNTTGLLPKAGLYCWCVDSVHSQMLPCLQAHSFLWCCFVIVTAAIMLHDCF